MDCMRSRATRLLVSSKGYFKSAVQQAAARVNFNAPPACVVYLVQMLKHYVRADNFFLPGTRTLPTLAPIWLKANQMDESADKKKSLKQVGDISLFYVGIFSPMFNRKIISLDYYLELGQSAYQHLASMQRTRRSVHLYQNLSKNFVACSDVLSEVGAPLRTNQDILQLYENFLISGSKRSLNKLHEANIIPAPYRVKKA